MPTTSSTVTALKLTKTNNSKGMRVSFSFASSPAWISSQQTVLSGIYLYLKHNKHDNRIFLYAFKQYQIMTGERFIHL